MTIQEPIAGKEDVRIFMAQNAKQIVQPELCNKEDVKLLILQVLGFPMSWASVDKALGAASVRNIDYTMMAELISRNQSLSGNILKIANSTYFGLSQQVPTVSRAIIVLGFEAVRSIALSATIMEAFPDNGEHEHFDRHRFWTHSLACAYLSKKIAGMTHRAKLETAFVCGLLHDIGKLVMDFYFPDSYSCVLARLSTGMMTSVEAENEIFGLNHAEVGTWLAQHWRFSKAVVFAIANHHGIIADDDRYRSLTATTRLANHLCSQQGVCLTDRLPKEPIEDSIMKELNLDKNDLRELKDTLAAQKDIFFSFSLI